jgi:hypothetical protein
VMFVPRHKVCILTRSHAEDTKKSRLYTFYSCALPYVYRPMSWAQRWEGESAVNHGSDVRYSSSLCVLLIAPVFRPLSRWTR